MPGAEESRELARHSPSRSCPWPLLKQRLQCPQRHAAARTRRDHMMPRAPRAAEPTHLPRLSPHPTGYCQRWGFTRRRLCRVHALPTGGGQAETLRTAHATHGHQPSPALEAGGDRQGEPSSPGPGSRPAASPRCAHAAALTRQSPRQSCCSHCPQQHLLASHLCHRLVILTTFQTFSLLSYSLWLYLISDF